MAGTSPRKPEAVDWQLLLKRLYWTAVRLVGHPDRAINCGNTAEDLVSQAVEEFYLSPNGLGWDGTESGLVKLLCCVVERRFVDNIRRDKKVVRDSETVLADAICDELGPDEYAAYKQLESIMLEAVKGHPKESELQDFIIAASMISSGSMVDKQMAELLGVTVGEVRNRRKMILRLAGIEQVRAAVVRRAK